MPSVGDQALNTQVSGDDSDLNIVYPQMLGLQDPS